MYKLRFFPSKLSADFWSDPSAERWEDRLLRAYLKQGDTVVDVGANIGTETLTAAVMVGGGGRVIAIEPHPRIFGYLLQNIASNGCTNIEPIQVAIAETEGILSMSDDLLDTSNAMNPTGPLAVSAKPLDVVLEQFAPLEVDLLKVDVEGYEYSALRSAGVTLKKVQCVYCEHINARRFGRNKEDLITLLAAAGFEASHMVGDDQNLLAFRDRDAFMRRTGDRLTLCALQRDPSGRWLHGMDCVPTARPHLPLGPQT